MLYLHKPFQQCLFKYRNNEALSTSYFLNFLFFSSSLNFSLNSQYLSFLLFSSVNSEQHLSKKKGPRSFMHDHIRDRSGLMSFIRYLSYLTFKNTDPPPRNGSTNLFDGLKCFSIFDKILVLPPAHFKNVRLGLFSSVICFSSSKTASRIFSLFIFRYFIPHQPAVCQEVRKPHHTMWIVFLLKVSYSCN